MGDVVTCRGLHCPGCGDGAAVVIGGGIVASLPVAERAASHAWEVLAVTAACGALAVTAGAALIRWGDRREAPHAAEHPFLITRGERAVRTANRGLSASSAGRPALGFRDLHIHLGGMPAGEQVPIIRQALPRPGADTLAAEEEAHDHGR